MIYKGKWWLPGNARKMVSGTLEINSQGEILLKIDGQFFISQRREDTFQPVILGRTDQGNITLYRNYLQNSGFRIEGYKYSTYEPQYVLTDGNIRNLEDKKFSKITLSYSNLFEWLNQRKQNLIHSEGLKTTYDFTPQEFLIKIDNNLSLNFIIYVTEQGSPLSPISVTINEEVNLVVKFKKGKNFDEILKIEYEVRNFLRFVTTKNVRLTKLFIGNQKKTRKKIYSSHEVIQPNKYPEKIDDVHWFEMLFTFKEQENCIKKIFINWFFKYNELLPVYYLYFNAFYSENTVLEQSFLNAIQALEAYHRRTNRNTVLPKEEHKEMVDTIVNSTPEIHREWLKSKLVFSNEPTLQDRIDDILDEFSEIKAVFIVDPEFSKKVKDYRHRFTHYDPKKTKNPLEFDDLFKQWIKLRLLLDACILKELGFSIEQITELIRKKYIHLLRRIELN